MLPAPTEATPRSRVSLEGPTPRGRPRSPARSSRTGQPRSRPLEDRPPRRATPRGASVLAELTARRPTAPGVSKPRLERSPPSKSRPFVLNCHLEGNPRLLPRTGQPARCCLPRPPPRSRVSLEGLSPVSKVASLTSKRSPRPGRPRRAVRLEPPARLEGSASAWATARVGVSASKPFDRPQPSLEA
jgi:hypothetical protein